MRLKVSRLSFVYISTLFVSSTDYFGMSFLDLNAIFVAILWIVGYCCKRQFLKCLAQCRDYIFVIIVIFKEYLYILYFLLNAYRKEIFHPPRLFKYINEY